MKSIALDGFNLNTVYQLSSKDNFLAVPGFEPGTAGWKARMYSDNKLIEKAVLQGG